MNDDGRTKRQRAMLKLGKLDLGDFEIELPKRQASIQIRAEALNEESGRFNKLGILKVSRGSVTWEEGERKKWTFSWAQFAEKMKA